MDLATAPKRDNTATSPLQFEKRLVELEGLLAKAKTEDERTTLAAELERERQSVSADLTPWQRVELARHAQRPKMLDYTSRIFEDFIELHGDRCSGEDTAMVGGIARYKGQSVILVGTQKGTSTEDKIYRKFGMSHPQGYRKALRLFEMAERLHLPIVTLVDTPAAHPDPEAEEHGQGPAIAANLLYLMRVKTPVFSVILGEGGSGGALGIAVGDWVAMFEHAIYVICPPERCAEILWRDASKKELAAAALKITAHDLKSLGVIDSVLPEPKGGAHRDPDGAAAALSAEIATFLAKAEAGEWTPQRRQQKFRRMGVWSEAS
ncbi:MAG: acetyl-CoA carboxylase carboxyltransferase subunit alpha [Candidatus Hydrogenedentes bacterium]|nr:acetyl-CoA carboxylase carboxyltransferase subunit alpha [Candidatus Hydrogenedentota bacterium]